MLPAFVREHPGVVAASLGKRISQSNLDRALRPDHHQLRGLFVADGSLFPTSLGGPPQISIYSFALHLAPHVIARAR